MNLKIHNSKSLLISIQISFYVLSSRLCILLQSGNRGYIPGNKPPGLKIATVKGSIAVLLRSEIATITV
jgi:hypothetical protein